MFTIDVFHQMTPECGAWRVAATLYFQMGASLATFQLVPSVFSARARTAACSMPWRCVPRRQTCAAPGPFAPVFRHPGIPTHSCEDCYRLMPLPACRLLQRTSRSSPRFAGVAHLPGVSPYYLCSVWTADDSEKQSLERSRRACFVSRSL